MKRAFIVSTVAAVLVVVSAGAATQVAEWDVNTSWDATNKAVNSGLAGFGALVPADGANYYASGAGVGDRAYIMLDAPSYVTASGTTVSGTAFKASDGGYTEIGYIYLAPTIVAPANTGIGTNFAGTYGNMILFWQGAISSLRSCTGMYSSTAALYWNSTNHINVGVSESPASQMHLYNPLTETWATTEIGPNNFGSTITPLFASLRGQWIHFTKVHEICTAVVEGEDGVEHHYGEVRYYINGELMAKETYEYDLTGYDYIFRSETLGAIGGSSALIQGVGFSYRAAWSGVLSDAEIKANYVALTTPIPEPATMSLLALGGLALLRRRK